MLLASCASNDNKHSETLSGLSTVSALLVTVPLVPFAEAYHIINDTKGKTNEKMRLLSEKFDPVYNERIRMIEARDPQADATFLIEQNVIALIPSVPEANIYPGLLPQQAMTVSHEFNDETIKTNELLTYLAELMSQDPVHKDAGPDYFGDPYRNFIFAGAAYKQVFNSRMYAELGLVESRVNRAQGQ